MRSLRSRLRHLTRAIARSLGRSHAFALIAVLAVTITGSPAVRIKDIATWEGVRENQLIGYGLVVGLTDTGDSTTDPTSQSIAAALRRQGIVVDPEQLETGNAAAVLVTATLPAFGRAGQNLDITISSIGDAESLFGGTLVQTPLIGADGLVYAVAQGPLTMGGFSADAGGNAVSQNHLTMTRVANAGILERSSPVSLEGRSELTLLLNNPDFTTAQRVANAINSHLGPGTAEPRDAIAVDVALPEGADEHLVAYLSSLERLQVSPDTRATIIVNERTGTVVFTEDVQISTFAITHGNLTIQTTQLNTVSQPTPFSLGETTEIANTGVSVTQEDRPLAVVYEGVTLSELVDALNALGVTPRDLISILQAIRAAGALQADLRTI